MPLIIKKSYGHLESGYSDSGYHIGNLVNRIKIILNIKIILSG